MSKNGLGFFHEMLGIYQNEDKFYFKKNDYPSLDEAMVDALDQGGLTDFESWLERRCELDSAYQSVSINRKREHYAWFKDELNRYEDALIPKKPPKEPLTRIDILSSAKIAKSVIQNYDSRDVLDVLEFFESPRDLEEAIRISHDRLKPVYTEQVKNWYVEEGMIENELTESDLLESIKQTMKQGLSAVEKNEEFKDIFPSVGVSLSSEIKKSKSWEQLNSETD